MPKKRRGRPPGSKTKPKTPAPVPALKLHREPALDDARVDKVQNSASSQQREFSYLLTETPEDMVQRMAIKDANGCRTLNVILLPDVDSPYSIRLLAFFVREINVGERQRVAKAASA
jgi:hypothetical protein